MGNSLLFVALLEFTFDSNRKLFVREYFGTVMDSGERQAIVEAAVAAVQALDNQGLYSGGAVRPDRFPSNIYSHWLEWKRHFVWISEANGWTDDQSRSALPTCLTSWALDEFSAMPRHYRDQQHGQPPPTLQRMFGYLNPRMQL